MDKLTKSYWLSFPQKVSAGDDQRTKLIRRRRKLMTPEITTELNRNRELVVSAAKCPAREINLYYTAIMGKKL